MTRAIFLLALLAACGSDGKPPQDGAVPRDGSSDGGAGGDAADANSSQCTTPNACPCFSNDDCPAGTRCHAADPDHVYCEPGARGTGAPGTPCTGEMDCDSALCVDGTDQMRCSKTCTTMTDCPSELPRCVDLFEASICARQP
ncbi:MAG TPA: hypothetical protein VGM90_18690 [Kofleriaceae bacterium]